MIISYPYLPERSSADSEQDYEKRVFDFIQGHGVYPVSYDMRWHGGVHLYAPEITPVPVRAIADGEVVAYRRANKPVTYKPNPAAEEEECDNSFVLLKHETETGDGVKVVYYSLYMHLMSERERLKGDKSLKVVEAVRAATGEAVVKPTAGTKVWRKDILGYAGTMYRTKARAASGLNFFHFEIFTTDDALNAFWHDSQAEVEDAGKDGTKELWGSNYFIIPATTEFLDKHPDAGKANSKKPDEVNGIAFLPQTSGSNDKKLYVETRYHEGERYTIAWEAQDDGTLKRLTGEDGVKHPAEHYEYDLYQRASKLYPACPSAGYELLRFGRLIGPDTLPTDKQANWQPVTFGEGKIGYVNLTDSKIRKLSDADFPHFKDWLKVDESSGAFAEDGICDALQFKKLLKDADADRDGKVSEMEWATFAQGTGKAKLERLVSRFPTEWDGSNNDKRYARLKEEGQDFYDKPEPYQAFIDHLKDLQFWLETGLPSTVWHFQPIEFVRHFRKCGWLSKGEIARCVRATVRENNIEAATVALSAVITRIEDADTRRPADLYSNFSSALRRYGITRPLRQAHFFGQVLQETGRLEFMVEGGKDSYFNKYEPGTDQGKKLGNIQVGDGLRFKGRGLIQLTGRTNYTNYGKYRNKSYLSDDDAELLETRAYETTDAAGYYWVSKQRYTEQNKKLVPLGELGINSWADKGAEETARRNVTRCVNPGQMHFEFRQQYFEHAYFALNDVVTPPSNYKPAK